MGLVPITDKNKIADRTPCAVCCKWPKVKEKQPSVIFVASLVHGRFLLALL